jgi:preprotein translocase subunit SecY
VYGGQSTYIPFKVNTANVMPVIFASSLMQLPLFLVKMLSDRFEIFEWLKNSFQQTGFLFNALDFGLIVFFTFFYNELVFNPTKLADQMKKNGGFIPGVRPGKSTADFFYFILTRIGLVGAIYLGFLAILPNVLMAVVHMPFYLGGTSLLIAVGVALEFASQIEVHLIERRYEGFLKSGRLKAR